MLRITRHRVCDKTGRIHIDFDMFFGKKSWDTRYSFKRYILIKDIFIPIFYRG
jgi:hypothetical protein